MVPLATSWIGTLPGWLTFAGVIALALALRGGQIGPALGYLREANATLERENVELKRQLAELTAMVGTLRARTDLAPLQTALLRRMEAHEERAQGRFEKTVVLMELIAARLGPDNGHTQ
jgi:hypothetical protein